MSEMDSVTSIEPVGDVHVVTLRGEIDAFTAPSLREDLRHLVEDVGALAVVVDLASVTFLDSSALGALVGVLRRLRERGGRLRIVQPHTAAARIFELTGLDAVLELYPDREAALSAASE
jgi:anti-sigma B factor antagonist